jgi:hypothetical protein
VMVAATMLALVVSFARPPGSDEEEVDAPAVAKTLPAFAEQQPPPAPVEPPKVVEPKVAAPEPVVEPVKPAPAPEPAAVVKLTPTKSALKSLELTVTADGPQVRLVLNGRAKIRGAYLLTAPDRLVVDLDGATPQRSWTAPVKGVPGLERARVGLRKGGTRLVIDLTAAPRGVVRVGQTITLPQR